MECLCVTRWVFHARRSAASFRCRYALVIYTGAGNDIKRRLSMARMAFRMLNEVRRSSLYNTLTTSNLRHTTKAVSSRHACMDQISGESLRERPDETIHLRNQKIITKNIVCIFWHRAISNLCSTARRTGVPSLCEGAGDG